MEHRIEKHVSLAAHTTLHVGGVAAYFYRLKKEAELPDLVKFAKQVDVPIWVLGGGSNVLIADGELKRLVLKNELKGITVEAESAGVVHVTAAAGEGWDEFVAAMVARGLAGLENLSGIPGTVGAAPIQNINAYGAQVADVIESVRVFDTNTSAYRTLRNVECQFGYRDSVFKQPAGASYVVTAVTFSLAPAGERANLTYRSASQSIERYLSEKGITSPTVAEVREAILHVRSNIGMLQGQFRSAGSFFKNTIVDAEEFTRLKEIVLARFSLQHEQLSPWYWELPDGKVKISTAFLMECTDYNKRTYGTKRWKKVVGLSPKHSLSVVTEAGATATDVERFVIHIITAVRDTFGITIETEVNHIA